MHYNLCFKSTVYVGENIGSNLLDISLGDDFGFDPKSKGNISKNFKSGTTSNFAVITQRRKPSTK